MYNKIINILVITALGIFCLYLLTRNKSFAGIGCLIFLGIGLYKFIHDFVQKKKHKGEDDFPVHYRKMK